MLRNGEWIGRYFVDTLEGRVRKAPPLGLASELTKTEARRKLMNLIAEAGVNEPDYLNKITGSSVTFGEAADRWEAMRVPKLARSSQYMSPKLVAKHLRPFFGEMPVEQIKTGTINQWIVTMKGFAPKTVHNMYKLLSAIVTWHYKQQDEQPKKWSPDLPQIPDKEQRWFTPTEALAIIGEATGKHRVFCHLAYATGMRFGELSGLQVENVDLKRRVILVQHSVSYGKIGPTKNRKRREVFIDDETARLLAEHIGERKSGLVFSTRNGTPLRNGDVLHDVLYPICKKLGIKRGGMHAFRHGRVSLMVVNGAPHDVRLRQVGHSSLRIASAYTHFSEDYQRELANKLAAQLPNLTQLTQIGQVSVREAN